MWIIHLFGWLIDYHIHGQSVWNKFAENTKNEKKKKKDKDETKEWKKKL